MKTFPLSLEWYGVICRQWGCPEEMINKWHVSNKHGEIILSTKNEDEATEAWYREKAKAAEPPEQGELFP